MSDGSTQHKIHNAYIIICPLREEKVNKEWCRHVNSVTGRLQSPENPSDPYKKIEWKMNLSYQIISCSVSLYMLRKISAGS